MTTATETTSDATLAWRGFVGMLWQRDIDVRAFIQLNYTPYEGDETFLAPATPRTLGIWDTLNALFVEERKKGVLDISPIPTNGYFGDRLSDAELGDVDVVLLDLKAWDPELHTRYVGMDIGPILDFARRLAALRRRVWIRHVVVPGWTDDEDTPRQIARFAAGLGNVERVDVLPFHQLGRYKWAKLGMPYALQDAEPAAEDVVARSVAMFRAEGLRAY